MKKITIVVFPVTGEAEIKEISDDLYTMQELVGGGYVEAVYHEGYTLWCNEDGMSKGFPLNRFVGPHAILGNFFVSKDDDEGDMVSLTSEDVEEVKRLFAKDALKDIDSLKLL